MKGKTQGGWIYLEWSILTSEPVISLAKTKLSSETVQALEISFGTAEWLSRTGDNAG